MKNPFYSHFLEDLMISIGWQQHLGPLDLCVEEGSNALET